MATDEKERFMFNAMALIAKGLLLNGDTPEQVQESTGLSKEEVQALAKEVKEYLQHLDSTSKPVE